MSNVRKQLPTEPEIRFKGYTDAWEQRKAKNLFSNFVQKNSADLPVLSVTQNIGVVYRDKLNIDIKFKKDSLASYKAVMPGDFVISLRSFQGGFELSKIEGIISPAYTVFRFSDSENQRA